MLPRCKSSRRSRVAIAWTCVLLLAAGTPVAAQQLALSAVQFPEDRQVLVDFLPTQLAAGAHLKGEVEYERGQAAIQLEVDDLTPAVEHVAGTTAYVVWVVSRTGQAQNLGELWVRDRAEKVRLSTGQKEFALLVTAEANPQALQPSELVVFHSLPVTEHDSLTTEFLFTGFAPAAAEAPAGIVGLQIAADGPADLVQARSAVLLARERGAERYAPDLVAEAEMALAQAERARFKRGRLDYARRAVELATEAVRLTEQGDLEAQAAAVAEHQARETAALENRAAGAEQQRAEAEAEVQRLEVDQERLEDTVGDLREERRMLVDENQQLLADQLTLAGRLESALSEILEVRTTARGIIVSLPDILFDVDGATLRPEAEVGLARMAGVLMASPPVELSIEGHTDATGTSEHNLALSGERAASVYRFLAVQGIDESAMTASGFGESLPIADNLTAGGRQQNRRVEIVLTEVPA